MKILIVYAHYNPKSFSHALLESVLATLKSNPKHEVVVRDLYALKFNPVLDEADFAAHHGTRKTPDDVAEEQKFIAWSDLIVFIYPLWWAGLPAILKGYIDRVYSYGFAYTMLPGGKTEGLLKGKRVVILGPQGESKEHYEKTMWPAIAQTIDFDIFKCCGMQVADHVYYPSICAVSDEVRKGYLSAAAKTVDLHASA